MAKKQNLPAGRQLATGVVHKVPADLRKILTSDPAARAAWEDITPLARNVLGVYADRGATLIRIPPLIPALRRGVRTHGILELTRALINQSKYRQNKYRFSLSALGRTPR